MGRRRVLGHRFTVDGSITDPEKVAAILDMPASTTVTVTISRGNGPLPRFIPTRPTQRHTSSE